MQSRPTLRIDQRSCVEKLKRQALDPSPSITTDRNQHDSSIKASSAKSTTIPSAADVAAAWTAAWDENSQAYYWWNTITYETTWDNPTSVTAETDISPSSTHDTTSFPNDAQQQDSDTVPPTANNPLDSILDKIDTQVRGKLDGEAATDSHTQVPYASLFDDDSYGNNDDPYKFQAFFNAKTGRFTTASEAERLNPENLSIESRAKRQMQYYFDVDAYMDERNRERQAGISRQKRPLSKKDIERFKRAKQEKKSRRAREWLCD
ncbi:uncharacterized protein BYT42DRAFT_105046 [Radiomyces spectabilis]|uniref:uncharacterized protein n=1 Tax=Radiomyces spectabilis TaxID=64574 RepID=UPI0022209468|nr:uncharacterized protein BYT42DRAFT_105046 [Radiomyces spectabilis]KAI8369327.1 hypothetical protein BYT42DRAFT_105046 [Radiomyces spectabilis]